MRLGGCRAGGRRKFKLRLQRDTSDDEAHV